MLPPELRLHIAQSSFVAWKQMVGADPEVARLSLIPSVNSAARAGFLKKTTWTNADGSVETRETLPNGIGVQEKFFDGTLRQKRLLSGKGKADRVEILDETGERVVARFDLDDQGLYVGRYVEYDSQGNQVASFDVAQRVGMHYAKVNLARLLSVGFIAAIVYRLFF